MHFVKSLRHAARPWEQETGRTGWTTCVVLGSVACEQLRGWAPPYSFIAPCDVVSTPLMRHYETIHGAVKCLMEISHKTH